MLSEIVKGGTFVECTGSLFSDRNLPRTHWTGGFFLQVCLFKSKQLFPGGGCMHTMVSHGSGQCGSRKSEMIQSPGEKVEVPEGPV
jgi:hypothetical protein